MYIIAYYDYIFIISYSLYINFQDSYHYYRRLQWKTINHLPVHSLAAKWYVFKLDIYTFRLDDSRDNNVRAVA